MGEGDTFLNAVIGAVVSFVVSLFAPFAGAVVGGAVAGYLNRREGLKVGALSGVVASIPLLFVVFVLGAFFVAVPVMGGAGPRGGLALGLGGLLVGLLVFALLLAFNAALGALGGYLGGYLLEEEVFQ